MKRTWILRRRPRDREVTCAEGARHQGSINTKTASKWPFCVCSTGMEKYIEKCPPLITGSAGVNQKIHV